MSRPEGETWQTSPLRSFAFASLVATALCLITGVVYARSHQVTFGSDGLWVPGTGFDFRTYYIRYLYRHTPKFFSLDDYLWYYPAPAIFIYAPFLGFAHRAHNLALAYGLLITATVLGFLVYLATCARALLKAGAAGRTTALFCASVLLTAYPIYFSAQRGNIEGILWLIVALLVGLLYQRRYVLASVCIGLAGAFKIYPLLFCAVFFDRQSVKRYIYTLLTFTLITGAALFYLDPDFLESLAWVRFGVRQWTIDYSETYRDPEWDHSIFSLLKVVGHNHISSYRHAMASYMAIAGLIALALFLGRVRHLPMANKVLFVSCACITLPPTSFDYTLCMLYPPLAWLALYAVRYGRAQENVPGLALVLALLGLGVAPTTYIFSAEIPGLPGACKAVILIVLLAASVVFPLPEPSDKVLPVSPPILGRASS